MAQADQSIQNATFPTVRADINNNLAALFTDSSGNTAPSVTVAFQDWIDTSGANPLWKKRNAANNAWITLGTITGSAIAFEGTLPDQSGNSGKYLSTDGTVASWLTLAVGASMQVFTTSGTFTPTAGKTSFLVMATGGGGGGGGVYSSNGLTYSSGGGGAGGTAIRMYTSVEMGSSSAVTVGGGGGGGRGGVGGSFFADAGGTGGASIFDPDGSGLTITGSGGSGGGPANTSTGGAAGGGGATNSQFATDGQQGSGIVGGPSFWAGGRGRGGQGSTGSGNGPAGNAGTAGGVFILEF
jgi:hypothetical protein